MSIFDEVIEKYNELYAPEKQNSYGEKLSSIDIARRISPEKVDNILADARCYCDRLDSDLKDTVFSFPEILDDDESREDRLVHIVERELHRPICQIVIADYLSNLSYDEARSLWNVLSVCGTVKIYGDAELEFYHFTLYRNEMFRERFQASDKQFLSCVSAVPSFESRDAYISAVSASHIWYGEDFGDNSDCVPPELPCILGNIWDACHRTMKEIAEASGLSHRKLAERFCIPYRTVENWCGGKNDCPQYLKLMLQECLGLLQR